MERLLQYVWKYRFYDEAGLQTTDGMPITVIDAGIQNTDAGPDFFNAKIRIADTVWVGCVEIHRKASDWHTHRHDSNPAYDSVILHVVEDDDAPVRRTNGEIVRQAVIRVPPKVRENIEWLLSRDTPTPCLPRLAEIERIYLSTWMNALVSERLEKKTETALTLLAQYKDWNEVFYITLTRNFGFGTNSDAFEWLAKSLPFQYILKHRNNSLAVEALLFGQAGLLVEEIDETYYRRLQQEYLFLQKKYNLKPVGGFLFKRLRTRPVNFPHIRIAQLAAVWTTNDTLFSRILEDNRPETLRTCFDVSLPEYWDTHYHFGYVSPTRKKRIGATAINSVLINTVAPVLFAYGKKNGLAKYREHAMDLLERLTPEENSIVDDFKKAGLRAKNAADTQALVQLRREYCEKKKCLHCRIGYHLLRTSLR